MFKRIKFIWKFVQLYREELKNGADRETAISNAADWAVSERFKDAFGDDIDLDEGPDAESSDEICVCWSNRDDDPAWSDGVEFEVLPGHIALLRKMRFSWDGCEVGAPQLSPSEPYGETNLMNQLEQIFGGDDREVLARNHFEMPAVLAHAVERGRFAAGDYSISNCDTDHIRSQLEYFDYADADLGINEDGTITVTEDHVRLLQSMNLRLAADPESYFDSGLYPIAACDSKRPYGDRSFFQLDMAESLGITLPTDSNGEVDEASEQMNRLLVMHHQMLGVIQAFVEQVEIDAGGTARFTD